MVDVSGAVVGSPGGFVPAYGIAFGAAGSPAVPVEPVNPLPVAQTVVAAASIALAGSTSATGAAGPFTPVLGRMIWLTLTGNWTGTVTVQRSIDGGITRLPMTVAGQPWASFTANANEAIGEESVAGASWYLQITLTAGTLAYRVQQ